MTDQLDQATDSELNKLFAVEVEGLIPRNSWSQWMDTPGGGNMPVLPPSYSTDANAVLPWLEKHPVWCVNKAIDTGNIVCQIINGESVRVWAYAPTFARAAVIALIRAQRATSSAASSTAPTPPPR